jgi:diguanylate cyclase (GGDEF)-like protein
VNNLIALAERIQRAMVEPFEIQGHRRTVGCSVGIAVAPADGCSSKDLVANADAALYRAKRAGRGTWRFFDPPMARGLPANLLPA